MAKKFNFADMSQAPAAQAANDTMVKAFEQTQQTHPLTPSRNEGGGIDTPSADTQSKSDTPSLNARAGEGLPAVQSTSEISSPRGGREGASVSTPVEHLASRRIQIQSEYNDAAVQAINLKTFPEAGNWKLEEVVRMFNLKRTPGTPKLTKGALAEMLLLDAANDLYEKVCGR